MESIHWTKLFMAALILSFSIGLVATIVSGLVH